MKKSRWTATIAVIALLLVTVAVVSAATYIVQPGDTLWRISRQFNTTVDAIVRTNNIPNPNLIYVGQTLEIPGDGAAPAPPAPPTVPGVPAPPAAQTMSSSRGTLSPGLLPGLERRCRRLPRLITSSTLT